MWNLMCSIERLMDGGPCLLNTIEWRALGEVDPHPTPSRNGKRLSVRRTVGT